MTVRRIPSIDNLFAAIQGDFRRALANANDAMGDVGDLETLLSGDETQQAVVEKRTLSKAARFP
jgi:hypothetical protein